MTLFQPCKGQTNNSVSQKTNFIDSIQNAQQLTELISKIDDRYKEFEVNDKLEFSDKKCQNLSDSLKVQSWKKVDFDNNGLTDIMVIGNWYDYSVICILDKGGKYEIKPITRRVFQDCTFPVVDNGKVKYYYWSDIEQGKWNEPRELKQITLVYKFGDFIEENQTPANHKIEKIEYSTTSCYGSCPVFRITINSDKSAIWKAEMYNEINNKEVKGSFNSVLKEDKYNDIVNLLNYIDFENLQDNYAVNWTDDQTSTLEITYDNGKVKSIRDYGLIGTFGLDRVYQLLFELRESQKWKK
ncbi:DUF6438 domain-containing protein [Flammeovirga aprica]|uniref:DUF6438 domain-containing protein n=1 Tax=Flammeovirga aprica JL-4 TaxID=694437 RepID=A0A7X9XB04_9BACT|nr:DUF6438 domain-containing protein [Flammeovirga aprica]NME70227.1 hypothetical protein [Flammeovirga aprica JL-4]